MEADNNRGLANIYNFFLVIIIRLINHFDSLIYIFNFGVLVCSLKPYISVDHTIRKVLNANAHIYKITSKNNFMKKKGEGRKLSNTSIKTFAIYHN